MRVVQCTVHTQRGATNKVEQRQQTLAQGRDQPQPTKINTTIEMYPSTATLENNNNLTENFPLSASK